MMKIYINKAGNDISNIESDCASHLQTIHELREKQQKFQEEMTQALENEREYARSAKEIATNLQSLRQEIKMLADQDGELSKRIERCQQEDNKLQEEKKEVMNLRYVDYLLKNNLLEE